MLNKWMISYIVTFLPHHRSLLLFIIPLRYSLTACITEGSVQETKTPPSSRRIWRHICLQNHLECLEASTLGWNSSNKLQNMIKVLYQTSCYLCHSQRVWSTWMSPLMMGLENKWSQLWSRDLEAMIRTLPPLHSDATTSQCLQSLRHHWAIAVEIDHISKALLARRNSQSSRVMTFWLLNLTQVYLTNYKVCWEI